ncbi:formyl-CoA transferase/CoA:oxalate CoA-transferase [Tamaricihabitans halophyticus]|uniref:Formyl-CoA transferase/CoA:oxalate CoA-transferase n=1 Tax=Tamaricihabitans halophyticus TaxID=1262583 RepID=A0A4R2R9S1_9PSEU|nr:CoA transferase [Tamaricihabitans halophyticus]TCP56431.1 formyl-CoA transferase/CoA:oxalate CoA-transferase [Tamaricihabitans halophyticus]
MSGPFAGITVVEFGQFVVVPFCAQLLADGGARVIKVEPPQGDGYRGWPDPLAPGLTRQFLIKNRGKESIAVNLGHSGASEVVDALISSADVVLANLSPAAMVRHGLDYPRIAKINPRIVYGTVSAYGAIGPEAGRAGMDVVVQARSGLVSSLGAERAGVPLHSEVQVADYAAAMLLYGGISSALFARTHTGKGQQVEVSLLGGALAVQNNALGHASDRDQWRTEFVTNHLPRLRGAGADKDEIGAARNQLRPDPPGHTAHYRVFRTSDGYLAIGAGSLPARRRLVEAMGLAAELGTGDPAELGQQLDTALRQNTSRHWVNLLIDYDVPVAEVRHIDELLFDEHARAEGLIVDYEHPAAGSYRGLGPPIRLSDTPMTTSKPAPSFAADTLNLLAELGFPAAKRDSLCTEGVVVDGSSAPFPD